MDLPDLVDQSLANHMTTLIRPHPQALASARPELGRRIGSLLAALEAIAPAKGSFRAAIHRDLHLRQMLADDERIWIVDWDLAGVGDPAIDIGNLDVWLETHLARDLASRCRDRFLTGYVDVAGHDAVRRAGTYRGFAYLRLACKRFRLGEDVETRVRPMIEGAEAALGSSC